MAERKFYQRVLRIEPGVALTQWGYERIANNWALLTSIFVGGGGMTYLASITEILKPLGPAGIGGVAIASFLVLWIGLTYARYLRAKTRQRHANADAIEKWKGQVDTLNPLDPEFHRLRIKIEELVHPLTNRISKKRFIDCQLMGPANLVMIGRTSITHATFGNCDFVVLNNKKGILVNNAIIIEDCEIYGGEINSCTIFIVSALIGAFQKMGVGFVSFTGDEAIDNPQPQGTEGKTPPKTPPG